MVARRLSTCHLAPSWVVESRSVMVPFNVESHWYQALVGQGDYKPKEPRGEASSSPSEDYLAVLAGQRQWIATTNFAGCPSRPPDSFANSAVLTTSAKFLMRWAGPSARAFLCRLTPKRNSLSRLWPVQISDHSPFTFSSPRSRNCRNPLPCLIWPNTGSTVCIRKA